MELFRFRLASLYIEAILQEPTTYRRRKCLGETAGGLRLGDAYDETIKRIKDQGGNKARLGMAALMWVSHAQRLLTAQELCHALGVDPDSKTFNRDDVPSVTTLLVCCQGLIVVDQETSAVRLIHFSLKIYLSSNRDMFSQPHRTMSKICSGYLKSEQVKAIPTDTAPTALGTSFLEYCAKYGDIHERKGMSDSEALVVLIALVVTFSIVYLMFI